MKGLLPGTAALVCMAGLLWVLFGGPIVPLSLPMAHAVGWDTFFILENALEAAIVTAPAVILIVACRRRGFWSQTFILWSLADIYFVVTGVVLGGVMARAQSDIVLQETYYVVAHFRYATHVGAVFALFAGFYFWFPKVTGFRVNDLLGKVHFWLAFIGVNLAFLPLHFFTLADMPRRAADYAQGYELSTRVAQIGGLVAGLGALVFVAVLVEALVRRRAVEAPA